MSGNSREVRALDEGEMSRARNVGVGCFATFIGAPSGAMVGVLVAKFAGTVRKCVPLEGLPACDWWTYALVGGIVGAISLPTLVLWRLRRGTKPATRLTQ